MTAQHTNRSSPIQEATTPANVAADSFAQELMNIKCLVICKSTGKDATSEH